MSDGDLVVEFSVFDEFVVLVDDLVTWGKWVGMSGSVELPE